MDKSEFYDFMLSVITDMERQGRYSTAHVYHCALKSAVKYGGHSLHMEDLTPGWLQSYQEYLLKQSLLWNTISTYMRMLRAVYNRAVDMGLAPYIPRQFKNVFTGRYANHQRALKKGGIKTLWALGLPGKVFPVSAGSILADTVLTILEERGNKTGVAGRCCGRGSGPFIRKRTCRIL